MHAPYASYHAICVRQGRMYLCFSLKQKKGALYQLRPKTPEDSHVCIAPPANFLLPRRCSAAVPWGRALRACRHWQDRDCQGHGQVRRDPVHRLQLLRRHHLQNDGEVLFGVCATRLTARRAHAHIRTHTHTHTHTRLWGVSRAHVHSTFTHTHTHTHACSHMVFGTNSIRCESEPLLQCV